MGMAKKAHIFIVEDHPSTARALRMYLETQGYRVDHASDMASALAMAGNDGKFDLLICDISLPDGTGWDLMKKLSARSALRGIAYTASGSDDDMARSKKAGFIKHLVKGCSTEELTQAIEDA